MQRHQPRHLARSEPAPGGRLGRSALAAGLGIVAVVATVVSALVVLNRTDDIEVEMAGPDDPALTTTTEEPRSTTTIVQPRQAALVFGGDVLIHQAVWQAAAVADGYDFSPLFDPIAAHLRRSDLAICHLEVTLAQPGQTFTGYPRFRSPPALATDLVEAGFHGCSTASNHALDYGEAGVTATLDAFDLAGLAHAGTARSPEEDVRPTLYVAGGITIAHLSYSYGFNGLRPPEGKEWLADQIDPTRILADGRVAREAGAELVVASLHWGNEYAHGITREQQAVAEALAADAGVIDLVIGHHAHVVQPISKVGDLWVVWGMGNLLSNNTPACCQRDATDGVLVTVMVGERPRATGLAVREIRFTPTWNERGTYRVLPAAETLAAGAVPAALEAELRASFERTAGHILSLAGDSLPIRPSLPLPPSSPGP